MKRSVYIFCLAAIMFLIPDLRAQTYCIMEGDTLKLDKATDVRAVVGGYIVDYFGDRGYPFAEAVLDGYTRTGEAEYFLYRISRGESVRIDTVVFGDYSPREISLLSRYITLPESGDFHFTQVRSMIAELKTNPLLNVEERADIYGNGLRLYTEAKQDIRFDAILGYKEENERRGVVGDVSCELINLFGLGRVATFYWSRPALAVNAFDITYTEPYILNKPFSVQGSFSQRYQDSLYVKRDLDLGVIYHINTRSHFMIEYRNERISTTEAGIDSGFVTQTRSGSTLSMKWRSRPGSFSVYGTVRTSLHVNSGTFLSRSELNTRMSLQVARFGTRVHILGGYAGSDDPIALYDKFKLGGALFLRGAFFEQYITNAFFGWKIESGYFHEQLRLFAFYDGVWMHHPQPFSHHVGIGLTLPAGKNSVTIGLGVNLAESVQQAKFHLSWNMQDTSYP
ncbi:MAG: hypothetical protein K0B52_06390 [FCB group bacterium]|nr:hypothetical protein [FCB group bacterium]